MQPWKVLASRSLFNRPPWLRLWEEDVQLPTGMVIDGFLRSEARDYAVIFAQRTDGKVPLVRQYKHGTGRISTDLPAGYLDSPDEDPLGAAQRELQEETGLTAPIWQALGDLVIDTNRGNTSAHVYLARQAVLTNHQELDDTEELDVDYFTLAELRSMVAEGTIDSVGSVAGILLGLQALALAAS